MTSSFLRCDLAAVEKIDEQYAKWDLMRAVYNSFNNSFGRSGVALTRIPSRAWHFLDIESICGPKVRC